MDCFLLAIQDCSKTLIKGGLPLEYTDADVNGPCY
jgi:hypothetical protein